MLFEVFFEVSSRAAKKLNLCAIDPRRRHGVTPKARKLLNLSTTESVKYRFCSNSCLYIFIIN